MTRRRNFTRMTKLAAWERAGGRCEAEIGGRPADGCGRKLFPGDRSAFDHIIPAEQGDDNSLANCQLLCLACHRAKTADDMKVIAKSRSVRAKHVGADRPKRIMLGSKASQWKRKLDGTVVPR